MKALSYSESGFTMIEVLAAAFVGTAFAIALAQALVFATIFRVRAQRATEASLWIQEDIALIKSLASPNDPASALATFPGSCDAQSYASGHAQGLSTLINADATLTSAEQLQRRLGAGSLEETTPNQQQGKAYGLIRSFETYASAPFNILRISYEVRELDNNGNPFGEPLLTQNVEIMPDVSLECPPQ